MDIQTIPLDELKNDLAESEADIKACQLALLHGIATYSGGRVQDRLDTNRRIVELITAELARREKEPA